MSGIERRGVALAVLSAAQLMVILDGTIVNVALPSIQRDLGFSQAGLVWVMNSFLIAFGGLLLFAGRLGDLLGARRIFLAGLVVFTVASVLCGIAVSPETLIAARFLQGVGGALSSAVVLGMIAGLYPEPAAQAKAFGVFAFTGSAGASIGVVSGGVLTELTSWHWIFLVNAPVGLVAVLAAVRVLRPDRGIGLSGGADVPGASLVTSGLMLGVATIVQVPQRGWSSAYTIGLGTVSILLLAGFVVRQATAARPLLPLGLFGSRRLTAANLVLFSMVATGFTFQFLTALYMQNVLGYGPLRTGLAYLSITFAIGVSSLLLSARLAGRYGALPVLLSGLVLFVAGVLLLARLPVDGTYAADMLPPMLLMGAGFGLSMPQVTAIAMSGASPQYAGLASGLFTTTQQVGGSVGVAVLATLATSRANGLVASGAEPPAATTAGFRLAFAIAAGLLAAGAVLAAVTLRSPARRVAGVPEPETAAC
jgi:EmrB/QacA subfamily drug resistance transporter